MAGVALKAVLVVCIPSPHADLRICAAALNTAELKVPLL